MTTSSKTNMNEELKKEFHKLWSTSEDAHFEIEEDKVWSWMETAITKAREEERKIIKSNIGMLRQWLNEDRITDKKMVTNEELEDWLLAGRIYPLTQDK